MPMQACSRRFCRWSVARCGVVGAMPTMSRISCRIDILLSIHVVRHTYDPGRPFGPWLATITARRIADAARRVSTRSANETTVDVMPETFSQDETKSDQDALDDQGEVNRALAGLSAPQREAIELMKLRGLSLEEASVVTGKSVSSLKVTVHRAMKVMRRILE